MNYTIETAAAALAAGETTLQSIATDTGWPIIDECLVPEPNMWHADDGNAEIVEEHASATEAAQSYVDGGDWGDSDLTTCWVKVWTWRVGIDADGDIVEVGRHSQKIAIEPDEPDCIEGQEHDWQSPLSIVGGCRENPGVFGSGGGVCITEVCMHCGCAKITDTYAQDPNDGEQGLDSIEYRPGKYAAKVDARLRKQVEFEVEHSINAGEALIIARLGDASASYMVAEEQDDDGGYSHMDSNNWPGPKGEWPDPPDALIAEARELATGWEGIGA